MELLQERYGGDPWKILVTSLLLKRTTRQQVEPNLEKFFLECPNPRSFLRSNTSRVRRLIQPLGLHNKRILELRDLAEKLVNGEVHTREDVLCIKGCGEYVADSYAIFVLQDFTIKPKDKQLQKYLACML